MKFIALTIFILSSLLQIGQANSATSLAGKTRQHKNHHFPLAEASINIELCGPIASTSWQLRYDNKTQSAAEGELNLSLRENTHVVGYAMDVNGKLRDGC